MSAKARLSDGQRRMLEQVNVKDSTIEQDYRWFRARLFDPLSVRSLIRRGLVRPSTQIPWMLKRNLDDISIQITKQGAAAVENGNGNHPITPNRIQKREHDGKYAFDGNLQRLCVCRHSLAVHSAGSPADCLLYSFPEGSPERQAEAAHGGMIKCGCRKFRLSRRKTTNEVEP